MFTALKNAGYKVVEIEKQDKKTLITISPNGVKRNVKKRYAEEINTVG